MWNVLILLTSYALLLATVPGVALGWMDSHSVHNYLLLSGAFSNAVLLVEALGHITSKVGRRHSDKLVFGVVTAQWMIVAIVIAYDVNRVGVSEGVLFWTGLVVVFGAPLTQIFVSNLRLLLSIQVLGGAALLVTQIPKLFDHLRPIGGELSAFLGGAVGVPAEFLQQRDRAWLHLLVIPFVYLAADWFMRHRHAVARNSLGLDLAVFLIGLTTAGAGIAIGLAAARDEHPHATYFFEEGASAVVLILGNHAFLVSHKRGFRYAWADARERAARLAARVRRAAPRAAGPAAENPAADPWGEWANRLWAAAACKWKERGDHERHYRTECVDPVVAGMIAGVYAGQIRLVDLGASNAVNVIPLIQRLARHEVEVAELVCVDRMRDALEEGERACERAGIETSVVEADLRTDPGRVAAAVRVSEHPTVYLLQYVLQEMPAIAPLLGAVAGRMTEADRAVVVLPDERFVHDLFDQHSPDGNSASQAFLDEAGIPLPADAARDWRWVGKYPLATADELYHLPHFDRPLEKIKELAGNAGLVVQGEAYVVVGRATEDVFAGLAYKDAIVSKPSAVVLVFRKPCA